MKKWFSLFAVLAAIIAIRVGYNVRADYEYSRKIGSFWDLSVKASTLALKADYLDRFVAAIDSAHLEGYNAIFFPTPDNDVAQNITTLRSLQHRLSEIRGMDVTGFAYQQAISEVTAQEQDEAHKMLEVLKGRWFLSHHPLYWDWVNVVIYLLLVIPCGFSAVGGFTIWVDS